jgi:hypothetical protein
MIKFRGTMVGLALAALASPACAEFSGHRPYAMILPHPAVADHAFRSLDKP